MDEATRILIIGGMSVLSLGFPLGIPMAEARKRAPRPPRYLFAAHLAAIIQGGLLLALTVSVELSNLSPGVATTAASLLVGGIVLFDLGLVVNWLQGVEDAFAEKSLGNKISTAGTPLVLVGTGILLYGVLMTMWVRSRFRGSGGRRGKRIRRRATRPVQWMADRGHVGNI